MRHPLNGIVSYDQSGAIRLRFASPARPDPENPYEPNLANFTMPNKSVTAIQMEGRDLLLKRSDGKMQATPGLCFEKLFLD